MAKRQTDPPPDYDSTGHPEDGPQPDDEHPVNGAAALLDKARRSERVRTRTMANRITRELHQLAGMVAGETEVAELEARLSAARRKAAGLDDDRHDDVDDGRATSTPPDEPGDLEDETDG